MPSPTLLTLNPTSLNLIGLGSTGTFTVSDAQTYSGYFKATSENTNIATVRPGGSYNEFIVTSTGSGTTNIDVSSTDGGFSQESVTVSNTGTIINAKGGR